MARRPRRWTGPLVGALLGALLAPAAVSPGSPAAAQQAPPAVAGDLPAPRPSRGPQVAPGSVLITRTPGVAAASLTRSLAARGLRLRGPVDPAGVGVVDTGGRPVADVVAELAGDPTVTSVSPNYIRSASEAPNDPLYTPRQRQYAGTVRLPAAWDRTTGSRYVEVAVLDTGVDLDHPDLAAKLLPGWDAVHGDPVPADDNGHGTFVAGIAAGRTGNGEGTAGVAWRSRIIPVKVLAANGSGTDADVVEGIRWAVDHGADVINLSLGGEGRSAAIDQWVDYALDRNVAVVAAAGNDGVDTPNYPAASPGVVSVGATDVDGQLAHFSNWGDTVDLVAPGMDIAATANGGGYAIGDGTSFAAPLTAGVVALLRAVEPALPARDVGNRVINSAKDIAGQGRDPQTGRGLL
ncbi:MAG TPA: S8 family serine peptidase, partial [Acidimicrobiales bacterium]|nr:S8 family serine peptidase [Acidimicrobiales bacterium]